MDHSATASQRQWSKKGAVLLIVFFGLFFLFLWWHNITWKEPPDKNNYWIGTVTRQSLDDASSLYSGVTVKYYSHDVTDDQGVLHFKLKGRLPTMNCKVGSKVRCTRTPEGREWIEEPIN